MDFITKKLQLKKFLLSKDLQTVNDDSSKEIKTTVKYQPHAFHILSYLF